MKEKNIVVLYHAECPDGFGSAFAFWNKYGDDAKYVPVSYGKKPPLFSGKKIYIVDFSYPIEEIKNMMIDNDVLIIDHHIGVYDELKVLDNYIYRSDMSGSTMSWSYLFPDAKIPSILKYIEDRDLWRFNLPNSKEILSAIDSYDRDFIVWKSLMDTLDESTDGGISRGENKLIREGASILRFKFQSIENIIKRKFTINILGHNIFCVNSPIFNSELATELSKDGVFGASYFFDGKFYNFSLRSSNDFDVASLAKKLGGGGHKNASGFKILDLKVLQHG